MPNPSFESYTSCPNTLSSNGDDEVARVTEWYSSNNSPDFFNTCSTTTICGVPNNIIGSQSAFDGNSYCGFIAYNKSSFYREIISAALSTSMTIGIKYFVSFKVSLGEDNNFKFCGVNNLGILLSTKKYDLVNLSPINNYAHIYASTIVTDTLNWTKISGIINADSNYKYLNIGNFFDDINTSKTILNPTASDSYYYIDDVRISTDSLFGLSTGLEEIDWENQINIYPNPTIDKIKIGTKIPVLKLCLFDNIGRLMIINENVKELNVEDLSEGLYFLKLELPNNQIIIKRVIKN
ncbi:MAG: hypothetical protein JWO32_2086 [Bacteroidetes bacterium]|nr:hypothetical protein [Bacteroidota bacterium]